MTAGKDLLPSKEGWWFTRTRQLMRMLENEAPDIVCLQEVTILQKFMLLFLKGYRMRGGLLQNQVLWRKRIYGKRVRCLHSEVRPMKVRRAYFRSYCLCLLKIGELRQLVVSTHIDWDSFTRWDQKHQVLEAMGKQKYGLCIVCGDFNVEGDRFGNLTPTNPQKDTFRTGGKIDYIFNDFGTTECEVLTQYKMSDHYPLTIKF